MFATSLNLLPGGQLDGGHIVASLWPRAHRVISVLAVAALLAMSWYFFTGWLLWAIFLLIAIRHPWVPDQPALDARRLWIALLGVVMLAITITPRPFPNMSLPEVIQQFRHGG
jgi:Zn-dependent protease